MCCSKFLRRPLLGLTAFVSCNGGSLIHFMVWPHEDRFWSTCPSSLQGRPVQTPKQVFNYFPRHLSYFLNWESFIPQFQECRYFQVFLLLGKYFRGCIRYKYHKTQFTIDMEDFNANIGSQTDDVEYGIGAFECRERNYRRRYAFEISSATQSLYHGFILQKGSTSQKHLGKPRW